MLSGVCFIAPAKEAGSEPRVHCFHESSRVDMSPLSMETIEEYAATDEPYDKAGGAQAAANMGLLRGRCASRTRSNPNRPLTLAPGYGIQGIAGTFVSGISGCYYNVMGFPIHRVCAEMIAFLGLEGERKRKRGESN